MAMLKVFGFILFLVLVNGCTYQYAQEATSSLSQKAGFSQHSNIERNRQIAIDAKNSFLIAIPSDDPSLIEFPEIVQELHHAMLRYANAVSFTGQAATLDDSIAYARSNQIDFLIVLKVIEFSSGVSSVIEIDQRFRNKRAFGFDRIQMQIQIWDVNEEVVIDSSYVSSKTPFFQFTRLDAVDLLASMFDDYSRLLFQYQSVAN